MTTTVPEQGDTAQAPDPREGYIKGLEALAQLLREHPELPLPYDGRGETHTAAIFIKGEAPLEQVLRYIQAMDEPPTLRVESGTNHDLRIIGRIRGFHVELYTAARKVCERAVTSRITGPDDRVLHEVAEWRIPAALLDAVGQTEGEVSRG
ncbi:hypothetical protein AB0O28_19225 [Microbispora sp. NPDC088329]|uniref:hypothetical protein n=1 Tax=Microbispora sp. NPDC088329 TaxID=3154869 RepID=UPI0034140AC0